MCHGCSPFYFTLLVEGLCARALPAAALESELVRPSFNTFDAADAAFADVTFSGALV